MAHRNVNRPGRAAGGSRGESQPHVAKQAAASAEGGARAAQGRRPACGAGGESAAGLEDGGPHPRRRAARHAALDYEALDILIVQQWTKTLRGPYDWGDWPLARYTLGAGILSAAERATERCASASARCSSSAVDRLAWVCAMVACGRAPRLRSIQMRPRGAGEQQLVRTDGARAWRCNVERDVPRGPQLHYWIHPSGLVEFEAVCGPGW